MQPQTSEKGTQPGPFAGFERPTANFIYTPNQFLDVCIPHNSRGVVRLVAYVLRRTLGWLDKNGEPIEQDIAVPFTELVDKAGISRGAIRDAIDQAVDRGFLCCTQQGRKSAAAHAAQTAHYRLHWDFNPQYADKPENFAGFYAGEGHRTPIPNSFFNRVIASEPLSVVKVVGTVLRHTVGYQNQFGRRTQAPLCYDYIQEVANLRDRPTLANAIKSAIESGYIIRVEDGCFDRRADHRKAAVYAIRWLSQAALSTTSSKTQPVASKQFKNPTKAGSRTQPVEQFKNPTTRKTELKNTYKQQPEPVVAVDSSKAFQLLRDAGFDEATAAVVSQRRPANEIEQQIRWLPLRNVQKNRLGFLRRAIEENWGKPSARGLARTAKAQDRSEHNDAADQEKRQRLEQRETLAKQWQALGEQERGRFYEQAIEAATSDFMRSRLQKHRGREERPPFEVLQLLHSQAKAPVRESI
jgi:hypothetical protein